MQESKGGSPEHVIGAPSVQECAADLLIALEPCRFFRKPTRYRYGYFRTIHTKSQSEKESMRCFGIGV